MPTNYRVSVIATHPLKIGTGAPDAHKIMGRLETSLVEELGMTPISAQIERADDANTFTEHEGKRWLHNAPDDMIIAFAKMLDGFVAQALDAESEVDSPEAVFAAGAGSVAAAEAYIAYRKTLAAS